MRLFCARKPGRKAKLCLMVAAWSGAGTAGAQPGGLELLKKGYEEEITRSVQPLREGYRKALLALEMQLAAKGDYPGARRVQAERREMDRLTGRGGSSSGGAGGAVVDESGAVILGLAGEGGGGVRAEAGAWGGWQAAGGLIRWLLPPGLRGGGYAVELVYASSGEGGLSLAVREDFHTLSRVVKLPAPPAEEAPSRVKLGTLRLRTGAMLLELTLTAPSSVKDFRLFELRIIPEEVRP